MSMRIIGLQRCTAFLHTTSRWIMKYSGAEALLPSLCPLFPLLSSPLVGYRLIKKKVRTSIPGEITGPYRQLGMDGKPLFLRESKPACQPKFGVGDASQILAFPPWGDESNAVG